MNEQTASQWVDSEGLRFHPHMRLIDAANIAASKDLQLVVEVNNAGQFFVTTRGRTHNIYKEIDS